MRSSRNTALDMIQEYKETIYKLAELTKETKPLYERVGKLRKYLATYKCRGVVTAEDLPYGNWESIQDQIDRIAEYIKDENARMQFGAYISPWPVIEDGFLDDVGGLHGDGLGYNPNGVLCGECTKESCSGCVNEHLTEEIHKWGVNYGKQSGSDKKRNL